MSDRRAPAWLTRWEYAHRGLHGASNGKRVPENSLTAARLAIEAGLGIECDIQRSADDHPIVFHDWDLKRLTGDEREFRTLTAEEVGQLLYIDSDERPATLTALLELVAGQVPLLIEIKSKRGYDVVSTCKVVAAALSEYRGDHAVMSFDPRVARWFGKHSPQTTAGLVMREDEHGYTQQWWRRRLGFWLAKPDFLAYHIAALPNRWVARMRRAGLPILTWTVNSPDNRARALQCADALIAEGEGLV